jgi:hypothetical protein
MRKKASAVPESRATAVERVAADFMVEDVYMIAVAVGEGIYVLAIIQVWDLKM